LAAIVSTPEGLLEIAAWRFLSVRELLQAASAPGVLDEHPVTMLEKAEL
jgi:hypothetical protein